MCRQVAAILQMRRGGKASNERYVEFATEALKFVRGLSQIHVEAPTDRWEKHMRDRWTIDFDADVVTVPCAAVTSAKPASSSAPAPGAPAPGAPAAQRPDTRIPLEEVPRLGPDATPVPAAPVLDLERVNAPAVAPLARNDLSQQIVRTLFSLTLTTSSSNRPAAAMERRNSCGGDRSLSA